MRAPSVTVRRIDQQRCELRCGSLRISYWRPMLGGYVREVSDDRPGTLGQQVSERLAHTGTMMSAVLVEGGER